MMDIAFRVSLVISVMIHSAVLVAMNGINIPSDQAEHKKPVVVDYVKQEMIPEERRQERASNKAHAETPQIYIPPKILIANRDKDTPTSAAKSKAIKPALSDAAVKQAKLVSSKDYISYNQIIRQKILGNLKKRYNERYEEGDVAVTFALNADGTLFGFDVDMANSTGNSALIDIATSSVRESSPFPPFPKGLSVPKMSFSLVIEFRKK